MGGDTWPSGWTSIQGVLLAGHFGRHWSHLSVTESLERAFGFRSVSLDELMIHADQGSQFTGKEFQKPLVDKEIKCSMSRKGICWDNAVVKTFFETLNDELDILDCLPRDPEQLLYDLWMFIERY
jgi:putative transposase